MRRTIVVLCSVGVGLMLAGSPAVASAAHLRVLGVEQVAQQTVLTPGSGGQSDVVVQSQVASDPAHPALAVAVTEAGIRATTAGTYGVALTEATTRDSGASWQSRVVPGVTVADGGAWQGVSWPSDGVGPDGAAYFVAAVRSRNACHSGLGVVRSTDPGRTFAPLVLVQSHSTCRVFEGRSSLAFDTDPVSPHYGRLYLAWTSYRNYNPDTGDETGQSQQLSYSDDHGATWSAPVNITAPDTFTFGNTLLVRPGGVLTDVYNLNSADFSVSDLDASTSIDDGATWSAPVRIAGWKFPTLGSSDIRCCAPSAAVDAVTGELYAVVGDPRFQHGRFDDAVLYHSTDAVHWSAPVKADTRSPRRQEHLTPEVAAYDGTVYVTWGLTPDPFGTSILEQAAASTDGGRTFGVPISFGPVGDLRYSALASGFGYYIGDVTGITATGGKAYVAWPLPSTPPRNGTQHQTLWAATLGS